MLAGVVVSTRLGVQATVFYLDGLPLMNLAAFAVIVARERETGLGDDISSLYGLGADRPWLAWPMTIAMLGARRASRRRRLLRQDLPDPGGRRQRLRLARRGDRARLGDLAGLLPARGRRGVDAVAAEARRAPRPRAGRPAIAGGSPRPRRRPGAPARRERPTWPPGRRRRSRAGAAAARSSFVAVVCALATIAFGVYPEPLFDVARDAGAALPLAGLTGASVLRAARLVAACASHASRTPARRPPSTRRCWPLVAAALAGAGAVVGARRASAAAVARRGPDGHLHRRRRRLPRRRRRGRRAGAVHGRRAARAGDGTRSRSLSVRLGGGDGVDGRDAARTGGGRRRASRRPGWASRGGLGVGAEPARASSSASRAPLDSLVAGGAAWEFPDAAAARASSPARRERRGAADVALRRRRRASVAARRRARASAGRRCTGVEATRADARARRSASAAGARRSTCAAARRRGARLARRGLRAAGRRRGDVVVEVTRERGALRELAFRTVEPARGRGRWSRRSRGSTCASRRTARRRRGSCAGGCRGRRARDDLRALMRRTVRAGIGRARGLRGRRRLARVRARGADRGSSSGSTSSASTVERRLVAASAWTDGRRRRRCATRLPAL